MKKITKILNLTVVVASMMTPLALLANSSNSVFNAKQEVNEVASESAVELDNVNNDVAVDSQAIDVNSATDNDETIGDRISSDNCTAEDSGQTSTTWMGITNDFIIASVNFEVSKEYVSESNVGEVKISSVSNKSITSTYLKIPSYIVFNDNGTDKKYNIVEISNNVFENCVNLSGQLDLSSATNLKTIGDKAFSFQTSVCNLTGPLTIPASVTIIGEDAFGSCKTITGPLTIPASVASIGSFAFFECQGLTSLDLSNATSLTTIGNSAFFYCTGLTGPLTIPASVTTIDESAFGWCSDLSLDLSNATSLTTIEYEAFAGWTGLSGSLTIPADVTSIGDRAFSDIGSQDFKFLSSTPPATLGTGIFGTNVAKTLWVPSAQAKAVYDPLAITKFGLIDSSYIKFPEIAPTSVDITGVNGPYTINLSDANVPFASAKADVKPVNATNINVDWFLEDAPTWLKIDANGNITANDGLKNATPGKFTFKVKVECQADPTVSNITNDIELNVVFAPITSLAIDNIGTFNLKLGENNPSLVTCTATVNPNPGTSQEVTWSIENNPSWININSTTGVISIKDAIDPTLVNKQQIIIVKAVSNQDPTKSATKDFTINFTKPDPIGVEILNLNTTEGYTVKAGTKFEAQLDWKVTPDYAKTEVNGKVTGPAGMSIDTSGKITYSPTQILPETNFTVTCTSKTSAVTTQSTSKITVTQPSPPSTDSFSWWWLLAAEAGALVLGSVISIIVIVKRKQELK